MGYEEGTYGAERQRSVGPIGVLWGNHTALLCRAEAMGFRRRIAKWGVGVAFG